MLKTPIVIFVLGVISSAWGILLLSKSLIGDPEMANAVGIPLIALGPLFMAIILRIVLKEGWGNAGLKLNFRRHWGSYLLVIVLPIGVIAIVYLLALATGAGHIADGSDKGLSTLVLLSLTLLIPMFFSSIGEEFGWRGYLLPKLESHGVSRLTNHLFIGLVWGFWHFPILILNSSEIEAGQLLLVLLLCIGMAMLYGEIWLRTQSVWPCVLLHTCMNTFNVSVGASGLLVVKDEFKGLISMSSTSLVVTSSWIVIGCFFYFRGARGES